MYAKCMEEQLNPNPLGEIEQTTHLMQTGENNKRHIDGCKILEYMGKLTLSDTRIHEI